MSTPELVFAFDEDGVLYVYGSYATAALKYEGVDVESGVVSFYDRRGTYLRPVFSVPNRGGKLFGLVSWVRSGKYELAPDPKASEDPFALALFEVRLLDPNPWFSSLADLKSTLAAEGVPVEPNSVTGTRET